MTSNPNIVIIGMGPCGLGAAWRLQQLGHQNFRIFEAKSYPGGLAASVVDEQGFTWDIGGHVQFSHYSYFDDLMDLLMGDDWVYHDRSSWIWIKERFVPYPFQNNIRYLPPEDIWKCLSGLLDANAHRTGTPQNFQEWIVAKFGAGIAELFLLPYNTKIWAHPLEMLSYDWIGDRVSTVNVSRIIENIILQKDDVSWGPNNRFRFPLKGGTGEIWKRLFQRLDPDKTFLDSELTEISLAEQYILFRNGRKELYDILISTIPLDRLLKLSDFREKSYVTKLHHSGTHIVGVGLKGRLPEYLQGKGWMYFPESNCPFYRVTVFSNYSPFNSPDPERYWSLMAEVSESSDKKVDHEKVCEDVVQGMLNTKLILAREQVTTVWYRYEPYGYPTPSLQRDEALEVIRILEGANVFSRGRFGAWKYETSNQDHSLMQGVELVNRLLRDEQEVTLWHPDVVNRKR